jgi:aspartate aminotransferase
VNGASKAYAMTGWRVGYAGGPKAMIAAMMNMQGQATAGVSTVGQAAVTAALEGPQDLIQSHRDDYRTGATSWSAGCARPRASPATSPRARSTCSPAWPAASARPRPPARRSRTTPTSWTALLEERHVATVQGAAYGMSPHFRISYATDLESLREGCKRIQEFCADLR